MKAIARRPAGRTQFGPGSTAITLGELQGSCNQGVICKSDNGKLQMPQQPVCPKCKNVVGRSRRRNLFEKLISWLFWIKPFRCTRCDHRHFRISRD